MTSASKASPRNSSTSTILYNDRRTVHLHPPAVPRDAQAGKGRAGAKIYLKPTKFIYEAGLDCVRVYAVGIIAFRYTRPNCNHGWQLAGDRDRIGKICVFGSEYGVTMRPASDKELSRNHTLIYNSEKTARQLWGIK